MDNRYFIIDYSGGYYYRRDIRYFPEYPGSILSGFGTWVMCDEDPIEYNGIKTQRIFHKNKRRTGECNIDGTLRLNQDGTVEEIFLYIDSDNVYCRPCASLPHYYQISKMKNDILLPNVLYRWANGTVNVYQKFNEYIENNNPELVKYIPYVKNDLYHLIYKYYKKHGGQSTTFIDDFCRLFVKQVMMKNIQNYELHAYIPAVTRRMFIFDGKDMDSYDTVRVMIPLTNPNRGKVKLTDIVLKYRKRIFNIVYKKLEKYSGIPSNYFKMDNCTVTCDDCLSFIFSVKDIPSMVEKDDE